MGVSESPANWYPDPYGRHEMRYFDGQNWTDHVASNGAQSTDPIATAAVNQVVGTDSNERVVGQIDKHLGDAQRRGLQADRTTQAGGTGSHGTDSGAGTEPVPMPTVSANLLDQRIFVVNQKAKLIEVNNEYAIYNSDGGQIGSVRQVGQSTLKKVARVVSSLDQFMTHHLQVVDYTNHVVLTLTRPTKFVKSKIVVKDGMGNDVGEIVQKNVFGKIRFALMAQGHEIGSINAENWRAWNFNIQDSQGQEVARITKTFEGVLRTAFTTADNYVVQVHQELIDPLRQLVVASALSVDTALKQDARGFG